MELGVNFSSLPTQKLLKLGLEAKEAIEAKDYETALKISTQISECIETDQAPAIVETDGAERDYSIVVVGYRAVEEHKPLIETLLALDPARFEIIFAENSETPIFDIGEDTAAGNLRILRMGANLGVGIARNLAIKSASGRGIIMIDDDGLTDEASIEALIDLFEAAEATAVRGKVLPKAEDIEPPQHYDPGDRIMPRYCDIEGMSIWRRSELMRVGMFDPILFGHEGVELTARLYVLNGPEAFLYQPKAVLYHDFALDPDKVHEKMERYEKLTHYIIHKNPDYQSTINVYRNMGNDLISPTLIQHRCQFAKASQLRKSDPKVSILTTCYNGAEFIPQFVEALSVQTDQNFELIFVDDGSDDGSADLLKEFLPAGTDCTVIDGGKVGRSGALNKALAAANCDICLVADVDDLPLPQRVEWTKYAYDLYPDAGMIGFLIYDVTSHVRASRPFPSEAVPLSVRRYFGMPSPFPGFSFRKSKTTQSFDESLKAGVDCDWMFRSLNLDRCDGYLIPLNITFYRLHEGQITTSRRHLQRETALRYLRERHNALLGPDEGDDESLALFAGWSPIENDADHEQMLNYALKLLAGAHRAEVDVNRLRQETYDHLNNSRLRLLSSHRHTLSRESEEFRNRMDHAEEAIDRIKKSSSWRLTRPLRAVGRLFGG